jgi:uncharacterized protein (DUF58 family)
MESTSLTLKQRISRSRFFRGESPVPGEIVLTQRRVFILPTWRGIGMALTITLLLLVAFVYNNNLVYLLAFLMAAIFFVSILHTYSGLAGLVVQAGIIQPVFAGETAGFVVTVTNPHQQFRPAITAMIENNPHLFHLEALEVKTLTLPVPTVHRGWRQMPTLTLACWYPLGIFRAWSPLRLDSRVLVYPQPSVVALPFPLSGGPANLVLHQDRIGGDEFNGVRTYQAGDPHRRIDWKAYAKGQGLFTKLYSGAAGGAEMWLDYDETPGGNLEERISQLCRWVIDAERAGFRYGLAIPGCRLQPDSGQTHYAICLQALALL